MSTPNSLNIEYLFLFLYNTATGVQHVSIGDALPQLIGTLQGIGIFFSLIFLAGLVYFHMRYGKLHHEHEHEMHAKAHAHGEGRHAHEEQYEPQGRVRWNHVMKLMTEPHQSSWRGAIVEADILLSELLRDLRLQGETIGEQLKSVNRAQFTTLDLAWEAHKIRNEIAHAGSAFDLTEREARRTIDLFRQVFEEFDYI